MHLGNVERLPWQRLPGRAPWFREPDQWLSYEQATPAAPMPSRPPAGLSPGNPPKAAPARVGTAIEGQPEDIAAALPSSPPRYPDHRRPGLFTRPHRYWRSVPGLAIPTRASARLHSLCRLNVWHCNPTLNRDPGLMNPHGTLANLHGGHADVTSHARTPQAVAQTTPLNRKGATLCQAPSHPAGGNPSGARRPDKRSLR